MLISVIEYDSWCYYGLFFQSQKYLDVSKNDFILLLVYCFNFNRKK